MELVENIYSEAYAEYMVIVNNVNIGIVTTENGEDWEYGYSIGSQITFVGDYSSKEEAAEKLLTELKEKLAETLKALA